MNARISVLVIFVEMKINLLLHNLHGCTFKKPSSNFFCLLFYITVTRLKKCLVLTSPKDF